MKKVVIVGAGISGLACAMELSKHKEYEIVILEGDSRIGGRIKDVSLGEDSYVDAGASWFHAAQNNPLYKLALEMFHNSINNNNNSNNNGNVDINKSEIKIDKKSKMMSKFYSSKFSITEEEEKRAAEIAEQLEAKFIEEMESFQQKDKKAVDESYAETLERLLTESSLSSQLKDPKTYQIFRAFVERFQSYEGGAFDTLSVKYCLEDHVANDPQSHKTGVPELGGGEGSEDYFVLTFGKFLQRFYNQKVINNERVSVRVNSKVVKIAQRPHITSCNCKVYLENGEYLECDRVVVTASLGVLKDDLIEFFPPLSPQKQHAIDYAQIGTMNKVIIMFEEDWWKVENTRLCFITRSLDLLSPYDHRNNNLPLHRRTDIRGTEPEIVDRIKNEMNLFAWNLSYSVSKPILMFLISPDYTKLVEKWSDTAIVEHILSVLRENFPSVAAEKIVPKDYVITRWHSNPFTRGSYCYRHVGVNGNVHDDLAEPFGFIHFAGEHTDRYRIGYSQGAYLSGIREADRIIQSSLQANL